MVKSTASTQDVNIELFKLFILLVNISNRNDIIIKTIAKNNNVPKDVIYKQFI